MIKFKSIQHPNNIPLNKQSKIFQNNLSKHNKLIQSHQR
jgi:hypothetical protein